MLKIGRTYFKNTAGWPMFFEKQVPGYFQDISDSFPGVFVWQYAIIMLNGYEIIWHDTFG